ncbi:hypothetical protein BG003_001463 [Podila horticola]|nr:hypothetical protein BG003_001463 [Podila horticola]
MDLFDSNLGKIALDCVEGHCSAVLKGVTDLFWSRLGQLKELLVEQLQAAIELPKLSRSGSDEIKNVAGVVGDDRAAFAECFSKIAIGKEQEEREGYSVISTDAKEKDGSSIGSTKMALPRAAQR